MELTSDSIAGFRDDETGMIGCVSGRTDVRAPLDICSPKRSHGQCVINAGWSGFFPYYAGFSEQFARRVIQSARLGDQAVVWDPWNGSGTTTHIASALGLRAVGCDLNPAILIVARARNLEANKAGDLEALWAAARCQASQEKHATARRDPLLKWFTSGATENIRKVSNALRRMYGGVDAGTVVAVEAHCAAIYVALFHCCRSMVGRFQTSNPTWIRARKIGERGISCNLERLLFAMDENVGGMLLSLGTVKIGRQPTFDSTNFLISDSTSPSIRPEFADFVLSSPPYCTRIDYTAATAIELAILGPQFATDEVVLRRAMIGTTMAPRRSIELSEAWGVTCLRFLDAVTRHPSKASSGYYYNTHLDYFDKLNRSLKNIAIAMKQDAGAVLVVQDSYYKEIHNDLPEIVSEMALNHGLKLMRRENFIPQKSLFRANRYNQVYKRPTMPTEAVLCFEKTVRYVAPIKLGAVASDHRVYNT